jgi:hypothetical protein
MLDLGTVKPGSTIRIPVNTFDSNDPSASVTATTWLNTDCHVHKDGGTTQRASSAGETLTINFDSVTGNHLLELDLADNTTANFYEAGSEYHVRIEGVTVDAGNVNAWIARFYIGYPGAILDTTIATLSSQTSFTLEDGSLDASAYLGCRCVIHDLASAVQVAFGVISAYAVTTKTVTLKADPGVFTMAAGDNISLFPPALTATTPGNTLDVTATGAAGIDWGNVENPTTALDLSGTDIQLCDTVTSLTGHTAQTADHTANIAAILTDTGTTLDDHLTDIKGTGFAKDTHSLTDVTADVTGLGTDSAALASVCTEPRLAELDAANLPADVDTLLTRITSTLFTGITSLAEWIGLLAGKQTGDATARTEIRATGGGSGTYDETTDSNEAIRDTAPLGTAMRGTDSAALASVCTEARLSELDAATGGKMANQVDVIETDTTALNDTKIPDTLSLANINAEVDTALDTAIPELGVAAPTATPTVRTGLMLMYMALRNKLVVQTSGTDAIEIYNNAGTKIAAKTISDDGSDYTEDEMA